ncbi:(Fe-S)-binding protein [Flavisolibacter ginsengisoli]|jgi:L-lactate dehydrogenase complex protein LldE|uniref:L-lactate dehydrogenase complex protein LldE n=1 Tax=Flavisolibacter ginsengisoli DSM 18119 TaxID=1121884 RepID=A0A1M4WR63_9BACT|nr:(Fe-S)-binding protein [Flavisolibacter ginsengisoli]SHE83715.1 L-lactate dehydrogenase complex protein LldE [Flavisolibacter ginsengisoli DSM 18119]
MNIQLFIPCFVDQLFPETAFNMIKVLEKAGCNVSYNTSQTCCGQPAFNAGFWDDAREVCTKFLNDFDPNQIIVAPSASCIGFIRNYYPKLFENSSLHNEVKAIGQNSFELSDFLVNKLGITSFGASLPGKATYHDSCAGLRECGIKNEPRLLLSKVKGLEIVEMEDVETCCGFGGTFAVKFEGISIGMAEQKVEHALATGAEYLVSTDLSCLMHLQGYIDNRKHSLKTMHLADVLAQGW